MSMHDVYLRDRSAVFACRISREVTPHDGKCTRRTHQVAEIDIKGKKYPRVHLYANPGRGIL